MAARVSGLSGRPIRFLIFLKLMHACGSDSLRLEGSGKMKSNGAPPSYPQAHIPEVVSFHYF